MSLHYFKQHFKTAYGGFLATSGGFTFGTWADMANYDLVVALVTYSHVASGSTLALTAYQATDSSGGASKTVAGASDAVTPSATTVTGVLIAQVRGQDIDVANGFRYVGFKTTSNDTTGYVAGVMIADRGRYSQATPPSL